MTPNKCATIVLLVAAMALPVSGQVSVVDNTTFCVFRSTVANLSQVTFTWTPETFAGFYYDIDKDVGTEQITFTLTNIDAAKSTATLSDYEGMSGIIYKTQAQDRNFKFKPWGSYKKIGFLAEPYFAAYNNVVTASMTAAGETVPFIADKSKNDNLMTNEQVTKILIDSNTETTFASDKPLELMDGYELAILSVNVNETKARVELRKDGQVVDTKMIQPGIVGATTADKTYYYKKDLGDTKEIVTIAVHFKALMHEATKDTADVDGMFQISNVPEPIKIDQQYGKMSIRNVDPTAFTITMDNKDNQVTLSKNKVTELMLGIFIKTADQDDIFADNPLRYYLFRIYDCQAGTWGKVG